MAFVDQRAGRNQRVAAMTVVAIIQGAAMVALVQGLAVRWTKTAPPPIPEATNVPITVPIPPPPKPIPEPQAKTPQTPLPVPNPWTPPSVPAPDPIPLPMPADDPLPMPTGAGAPPSPVPSPSPSFAPRAASPRNAPGSWASSSDYPAHDLRLGIQGVTRFSLAIGTDGRVTGCTVTATSGSASLDRAACDNVSRRARFDPATDGAGKRVAGRYDGAIRWQIPRE